MKAVVSETSKPLSMKELRRRLSSAGVRALGERNWRRTVLGATAFSIALTLGAVFAAFQWAFAGLPRDIDSQTLWSLNRPAGITFVDADGDPIAVRGPSHGRKVRLAELPDHVWQAFVAIEDQRFFEHDGVDRQAIARAAAANLEAGRTVQGGSTITQQLAKNLFLTPDRTLRRKVQEMIMAQRLERHLQKEEILELYLNRIFLGEQAYGVDAAARRYFGVPATRLSLAQAALIAGLPKAPSRSAPTANFAAAKERQSLVLAEMAEAGYITEGEREEALAEPLEIRRRRAEDPALSHVLDMAQEEARRHAGDTAPDLVVAVTVDPKLQRAAHRALSRASKAWSRRDRRLEGALVAIDQAGAIRALVGGVDYSGSKFNRAVQAQRQPGSTFKAFVYAAAFEQGYEPDTVRYDEPIQIGAWRPSNYDGEYRGAVTLRTAFAQSINTVAAEVATEIGPGRVAELAKRFGVRSELTPVPSLALGASEVTLLELTDAFSVFMREGARRDPFLVTRVANSAGEIVWERAPSQPQQVYERALSQKMTGMLGRVIQNGTGVRARLPNRDAAGKTGTSQEWRDAWFVGYTADFTAGVWLGYDDPRPMPRVTGGAAPAEVWAEFMRAAHEGLDPKPLPGIEPVTPDLPPRRAVAAGFYDALRDAFGSIFGDDDDDAPMTQ